MDQNEPSTQSQFDINCFDPGDVRLFNQPEGDSRTRMTVRDEVSYVDVRLARALPLSDPDHYLAIRDAQDNDIGLVVDWRRLDATSLRVAEAALGRSYMLPKVLKVNKVTDNFGVILWDVVTDFGQKRYVVRNLRDNSVALSTTRVLMSDADGDRFEFPDIHSYGPKALEVLLKVL
ncbi:MAG: DUF1854 domain-containing protein [Capsulimonadaceae bacterium]|nr:DUF1854 domain-containing protein [Capsulimonadaceae bacterium]